MAIPSNITDLSTTAASNSPAGSDSIGTSADDYLRVIQAIIKESGATLYTAGGTADVITFSTTPTFSAYASGQRFWVKASGANTGATTLNINALGAKNIYKNGATALSAGDIPAANAHFLVSYDGTQFQLLNPTNYLEGTFTPGFSFGGGTTGITYAAQTGAYTKIGNRVFCTGKVELSNKGSSTGQARITGLPFTVANAAANLSAPSLRVSGITFANIIQGYTEGNTTTVFLEECTNAGTVTSITDADFSNTSFITFSVNYYI